MQSNSKSNNKNNNKSNVNSSNKADERAADTVYAMDGQAADVMYPSLEDNMRYLSERLKPDTSFDIVYRVIEVGGRRACIYFIDGFCKDELMQKLLQYFIDMKPEDMPEDAYGMAKKATPYVEIDLKDRWDDIFYNILSGVFALFIEGYDRCVLIDSRTYPARSVSEPEKDKTLRGSKDGFVETVVFNTALIRRMQARVPGRISCFVIWTIA